MSVNISDLKESTADIPIIAVKIANVVWPEGEDPRFQGVASKLFYGRDANADCCQVLDGVRKLTHGPSPNFGSCGCGFYAMRPDAFGVASEAASGYQGVKLTVELSGRVLVAEHGYRAEHQRVLSVEPRGCCACLSRPADWYMDNGSHLLPMCNTCWTRDYPTYRPIKTAVLFERLGFPL